MDDLFLALLLISIIALVVGLIKPRLIFRWDSEKLTKFGYRKASFLVFTFLSILFFVLFGITVEPPELKDRAPNQQSVAEQTKEPVVVSEQKPPQQQGVEKPPLKPAPVKPAEETKTTPSPQAIQGVIFDIPVLFGKSFVQIKKAIGFPSREGAADEFTTGWAEWDKNGLTLSINYDTSGKLVDAGAIGCAMSIFPKVGYWEETKLRQAGNLTGSNYGFAVKPMKNINGIFYALEICHK